MKRLGLLPIIFFAGIFSFTGCKKDTVANNSVSGDFPPAISKIVTTALMDTLKKAGLTIYPGSKPPIVNGIYAMKSDSAIYAGGMKINDTEKFGDPFVYNFSAQDAANNTISLQFKDALDPTITGGGLSTAYISGSGNNFTIFSAATYLSVYGASATFLFVISGTLTSKGINNFQYCAYLLSKTEGVNSAVDNPVGYFGIDEEAYPFFTPKVPSF